MMVLSVAAFICGLIWCLSFVMCLGMKRYLPQRRHGLCAGFAVVNIIVSGNLFWMLLHPRANQIAPEGGGLIVPGCLGDLAGIVLGVVCIFCVIPWVKKWCAARADRRRNTATRRAAARVVVQPAEQRIEVSIPTVAASIEVPQAVVVDGKPILQSPPIASGALPLIVLVRGLRTELGLSSEESLAASIDAACGELGVSREGSLIERARACWNAIGGYDSTCAGISSM